MLSRFIKTGDRIPFPWGLSYRVCLRDGAMCHPVPFNWIVRLAVHAWWRVTIPRGFSDKESVEVMLAVQRDVEVDNERLRLRVVRLTIENDNLRTSLNQFLSGERTA